MSLKKIQTENQNETKEIFLKNEREKWDFIICRIPENQDFKKNLSEEDKDMIVNEISLVIQNIILETTGH